MNALIRSEEDAIRAAMLMTEPRTLRLLGLDSGGVIYRAGRELVLPGLIPTRSIGDWQRTTVMCQCAHGISLFVDDCERCGTNIKRCEECGTNGDHYCPSDVARGEEDEMLPAGP